jgi:phytol kinase
MNWFVERVIAFFVDNFPSWRAIAVGGPMGLLWAYLCLYFAGYLKRIKGLKTGYTRKTFHFLIFTSAVAVQRVWGTPILCLFGGMTTLVVFYAIFRGEGHLLYEAMARENDTPHRTHYIVVPYLATLIGGLTSNILFGPVAVVGYMVAGLADAIAEPVGTRFGKHRYRVPSFRRVKSTRSLEGSAAVFLACLPAITLGALLCPDLALTSRSFLTVPLLAVACTVLEGVSPHGWDNATMQVIPAFLAGIFFSINVA